ncbi:hypothetical protein O0L34_g8257 [Tuta absoluta]|nr:hypothetical protein O0L34_g8257 [Tuta absoluta]
MKSEIHGTVWKCSSCDKEFKYESEKRRHEQSHVPQFECKVCSKKFSFLSALRRHEKQHERTESVHCTKCGGKFRDEILLKRHIQYAHKGTFQCKKCSSIFNSEAALGIHMKTHRPESERRLRCSYDGCGKTFNFAHHLKHHELTHTDDKPHVCVECGKRFIQLHHLKIHQRVHKPDSWLTCRVRGCHKEFTNEYALKRHIATHKNKESKSVPSKSPEKETITKSRHLLEIKPLKTRRCFQEDTQNITKKIELLLVNSSPSIKQESHSPVLSILIEPETPEQNLVSVERAYDNEVDTKDNFDEFDTKGATADENVEIDDIDLSVSNCKSVLGKCMETGDSEPNENCLCTQITCVENAVDFNDVCDLQKTNNDVQVNIIDDLKCIEKRRKDANACETCECASICGIKDKGTDFVEIETPEFELRNDSVIKIKDTFDMDLENLNGENRNTIEIKNNLKPKVDNMMISCKDVLGNCIVSGNGTIGEGCLCARMTADDQQIIAQEIEDLTICPKINNSLD